MQPLAAGSLIVKVSVAAGAVSLALTLLFIGAAFVLRAVSVRREGRVDALEEKWTPVLLAALRSEDAAAHPPAEVPPIGSDAASVVTLWNRLAANLRGDTLDLLTAFARRAGIGEAARRLVNEGRPAERVVGAACLGHVGDTNDLPALLALAREPALVARAEAARAIARIDPEGGARTAGALIAGWDDCHATTAGAILSSLSPETASAVVAREALGAVDPARQQRLLDVLASMPGQAGADAARQILAGAHDAEVVSRCLRVITRNRDARDAPLVRRFLHHPAGFVRVSAVAALGRLGAPGDEWMIVGALDDRDWWVRYQAARASVSAGRLPRALLDLFSHVHPDRYARGALDHALTEAGAVR